MDKAVTKCAQKDRIRDLTATKTKPWEEQQRFQEAEKTTLTTKKNKK